MPNTGLPAYADTNAVTPFFGSHEMMKEEDASSKKSIGEICHAAQIMEVGQVSPSLPPDPTLFWIIDRDRRRGGGGARAEDGRVGYIFTTDRWHHSVPKWFQHHAVQK